MDDLPTSTILGFVRKIWYKDVTTMSMLQTRRETDAVKCESMNAKYLILDFISGELDFSTVRRTVMKPAAVEAVKRLAVKQA